MHVKTDELSLDFDNICLRQEISYSGSESRLYSAYRGLAFLVDRAGLDGGRPSRSGVHLSNISRVISGPLGFGGLSV